MERNYVIFAYETAKSHAARDGRKMMMMKSMNETVIQKQRRRCYLETLETNGGRETRGREVRREGWGGASGEGGKEGRKGREGKEVKEAMAE